MGRRARWTLGAAVALVGLVVAGTLVVASRRSPALPRSEAQAYLRAWARGDVRALQGLATPPRATVAEWHRRFRDELRLERSSFRLGPLSRAAGGATAAFSATHSVRGLGEWSYGGEMRFVRRDGRWLVSWSPEVLHPSITEGDELARHRARPAE